MRIKGVVAAAAIFGVLAAFTVFTVPCAVEEGPAHVELEGREKAPGEKEPKGKEPEMKVPEKETPEKKGPEDKAPIKEKKRDRKKVWEEFEKDPITVLENRKKEIEGLLKEGRISKEEAEAILRRIDKGIAEIKEFNGLPLEEKRARLIRDCKDYLDSLVERGEMDRDKADRIFEKYSDRTNKWDGTGYPRFFRKAGKPKNGKSERDL